ncbi:hypothetical protein FCV41_12660 [Clostridium argentinense]|nr:hypothetical protein [Clostridium argentinense]
MNILIILKLFIGGEIIMLTERDLNKYFKDNKGIESKFGLISINSSDKIGQGGNGLVYKATLGVNEFAIKFLMNYNNDKYKRFKAEYLNVNIARNKLVNSVNNIYFDELKVNENIIPYIMMEMYEKSLSQKRREINDNFSWKDVNELMNFLFESVKSIHDSNIIHRDLKPENILIDTKGKYHIADFGIAYYNPSEFEVKGETKKGDRLANFEFSAPEQINSKNQITQAADIFSMAQIIYWFIFGHVHKGTGMKNINDKFANNEAIALQCILSKCLQNDKENRYQSVDDVINEYNKNIKELANENKNDPFKDMRTFSEIMRSVNPDFYGFSIIDNKFEIEELFQKISNGDFDQPLWFNTGSSNSDLKKIEKLDNGNYSIDGMEINVIKVWGSVSDTLYNDLCIIETSVIEPYKIDGKEYGNVAIVNNDIMLPIEKLYSGFIKINNKVISTRDVEIEERYIFDENKYILIGPEYNCVNMENNDSLIEELQHIEELNSDIILSFKKNISKNKSLEVRLRL